jgi:hypothetical protein
MKFLKWIKSLFSTNVDLDGHMVSLKCAKEITQYLLDGKKVNAIKVLRAHTGLGLKESKAIIDGLNCPTVAEVAEAMGEPLPEEVDAGMDADEGEWDEAHLTESQMAGDVKAAEAAVDEALTETATFMATDLRQSRSIE